MVFITAGMGGGTGTGAAPVIAELAKNKDILTVGIVTIPFQFEGKVRHEQALIGVENLRKHVDSLIVINNNKLREVYGNLGFKAGYAKSDEVLSTASKGIAEVITQHFTQNIDLRDAKTVLSNSGTAIMGSATATGENRAKEAIMSALDSPLLNENKITGAINVLLLIVCGKEAEDEITLDEIGEINDFIQSESGNNANIIMGVGEDEKLGNSISVTIIATGFNPEQQSELINKDNVIKHMLGAEQAAVQKLNVNSDVKFAPVNTQPTPVQQPVQNFVQENTQQQNVLDNTIAPIKPARIVHVLDEEVEDFGKKTYNEVNVGASNVTSNMPSPAVNVNSLDVFFEIVEPKVTENQINDFQPEVIVAPIVTDTTIHQNSLNFDIVDSNSQNEIFEITEKQIFNSKTLFFEDEVVPVIPQENVQSPVAQTTPNTEDLVIKHVLDIDTYIKHEENLLNAKPIEEASPKANETIEPALEMTLRTEAPVDFVRDSVENQDNIQNLAYKQELKQTTPSRRQKLKDFNYKFSNNRNPAELDKPAFERLGINIHTDSHKQENVGASRYSVETDNNDLKIRSNNSFLHDNVD